MAARPASWPPSKRWFCNACVSETPSLTRRCPMFTLPAWNCLPRLTRWIHSWGLRSQSSPPSQGRQLLADKSAPDPGRRTGPPDQATPQNLCTAKA